jgi:hypothetical protein
MKNATPDGLAPLVWRGCSIKYLRHVAGLLAAIVVGVALALLADSFVLGGILSVVILSVVILSVVLYLAWESRSHGRVAGHLSGGEEGR